MSIVAVDPSPELNHFVLREVLTRHGVLNLVSYQVDMDDGGFRMLNVWTLFQIYLTVADGPKLH